MDRGEATKNIVRGFKAGENHRANGGSGEKVSNGQNGGGGSGAEGGQSGEWANATGGGGGSGGILGGITSALGISDIRLKENIELLEKGKHYES